MFRKIELTKGFEAIVDTHLYENLNKYNWYAMSTRGYTYAVRDDRSSGKKVHVRMHREIIKAPKNKVVDHINHNTLDNRIENLRICTAQQNHWNGKPREFRGIYWDLARQKFSCIFRKPDGSRIHLGRFNEPEVAELMYFMAIIFYWGDFANG